MELKDLFSDLVICETGKEKCIPFKYCLPAVQFHYNLHYIESGEGTYRVNGREYKLGANDIFFMPKGVVTEYYPLRERPWSYVWVQFDGKICEDLMSYCGFSEDSPCLYNTKNDKIASLFLQLAEDTEFDSLKQMGFLYVLFDELAQLRGKHELSSAEKLYRSALQFIKYNHLIYDLTVAQIADSLNISGNYLCTIFKEKMNMTPKQYITKLRFEHACRCLSETTMMVKDIAEEVGYRDSLYFFKEFKRLYGYSPTEYRRKSINGNKLEQIINEN